MTSKIPRLSLISLCMWLQAYGFSKTLLSFGRRGLFVFPFKFNPFLCKISSPVLSCASIQFHLYVREG